MEQKSIIIAGGGIAGLTMAIALKRIGIQATVLEAAKEWKPVGAGITLAQNAMRVFECLGIAEEVEKAGIALQLASIQDAGGRMISEVNLKKANANWKNVGIHRAELHRVLLQQLDDDQVRYGEKVMSYGQINGQLEVLCESNNSYPCNYLIVAEGIHSPIRYQILPDSKIRYSGYTCWRGVIDNYHLENKQAVEIWGAAGRFGYVPIGNNKVYWFATKNAEEQSLEMQEWKSEALLKNFQNYPDEVKNLIQSTPDSGIIWNDIIDLKPINSFDYGSVVLIGDAAHATTPNLGQGACQAIEDAYYLAKLIQNADEIETAFNRFSAIRLERTQTIVKTSRNIGKLAQNTNPLISSIRNSLFRLLPQKAAIRQMKPILDIKITPLTRKL